jgi:hypothetical protein
MFSSNASTSSATIVSLSVTAACGIAVDGAALIGTSFAGVGVSNTVNSRQPAARAATINNTLSHLIAFMVITSF